MKMHTIAVLVSCASVLALEASSIVNGSFESPDVSGSTGFQTHDTGSTMLSGWTVVSGSVDTVDSTFFPPHQGNQSLDLDGLSAGTIEQSIATTPGITYRLSFYYANNPGGTTPASANVTVHGANLTLINQTITKEDSTPTDMNFALFDAVFTANSTTTVFRISSLSPPESVGGIVLDSVSLVTTASLYNPKLVGVSIQSALDNQPPRFSGTVTNGPPLGTARLQASLDLGTTDQWADVASVPLDSEGSATFTNILDSRPQALGARSDFFRVVTEAPTPP